jgi:aspartyl protease family protein
MLRIAVFFAFAGLAAAMLAGGAMPGLVQNIAASAPPAAPSAPAAPAPVLVNPASYGEVAIAADPGGQYTSDVVVNGQYVRMMVDTGATMVVLSSRTAQRIGLSLYPGDFKGRVQTANGVARVAPVTLGAMQIGSIALYNVEAWVLDGAAGNVDLLGMSFLKRLASVEQKSGELILRR